jgi:cellulose synthase/poly-beta-1,6-N-acetylglucosamine synthase-like glycosyltransferase
MRCTPRTVPTRRASWSVPVLDAIAIFLVSFEVLVFVYFLVLNLGYTLVTSYAFRHVQSGMSATGDLGVVQHRISEANARPISVVVPAFNEQATITSTVTSILNADYPEHEVIVVDDGSTDATLATLLAAYKAFPIERPVKRLFVHQPVTTLYLSSIHPNLWIVAKKNGGKADALNTGIEYSRFPLVCAIDADSILERDALLRLGQQFVLDRRLIAVGGAVRVLNGCHVENSEVREIRAPSRLIECVQVAEYMRGFLAGRVAWQSARSLLIISGAFGVFRKDLLEAVGGYRKTVGEDMDIVIRLHRHCIDHGIPYELGFVPEPVCWTQVPTDMRSLLQQRNRWQRGLADCLWHNRNMFLNPTYGKVGMIGFPYFFVFELIGPLIEFLGYTGFVVFALLGWVDTKIALLFFVIAVLWGMWLNAAGVLIDNLVLHRYTRVRDALKVALFGSLEFMGIRQLVAVERLIGTFQMSHHRWGAIRRHRVESAG